MSLEKFAFVGKLGRDLEQFSDLICKLNELKERFEYETKCVFHHRERGSSTAVLYGNILWSYNYRFQAFGVRLYLLVCY